MFPRAGWVARWPGAPACLATPCGLGTVGRTVRPAERAEPARGAAGRRRLYRTGRPGPLESALLTGGAHESGGRDRRSCCRSTAAGRAAVTHPNHALGTGLAGPRERNDRPRPTDRPEHRAVAPSDDHCGASRDCNTRQRTDLGDPRGRCSSFSWCARISVYPRPWPCFRVDGVGRD